MSCEYLGILANCFQQASSDPCRCGEPCAPEPSGDGDKDFDSFFTGNKALLSRLIHRGMLVKITLKG